MLVVDGVPVIAEESIFVESVDVVEVLEVVEPASAEEEDLVFNDD